MGDSKHVYNNKMKAFCAAQFRNKRGRYVSSIRNDEIDPFVR